MAIQFSLTSPHVKDLSTLEHWLTLPAILDSIEDSSRLCSDFQNWFQGKKQREEIFLLIKHEKEGGETPIGTALLESGDQFLIALAPVFQHQGIAAKAILAAAKEITRSKGLSKLFANIPRTHTAAVRAFSKARFKFERAGIYQGRYCQQYSFTASTPDVPAS